MHETSQRLALKWACQLLRLLKRRVALDVEKRNVDDTAAAAAAAASVVDNSVARQLDRANAIIAAAQRRLGVERSVASHADTLVTNENDTDASRLHSAALIAVVKAVSFATRNVSDAALLAQQRGGAASLERPALNVAAATTHTVDLALSSATYDVTALRASIKGIDQAVAHMRVHATTHLRADAPTTRALNETCLELLERTRLLFEFVANDADATAAAAAAPPLPPSSVPASLRMYVQREYEAQERILRVEKELSDARLALARVRTDRYRSFGLSGK